MLAELLPVFSIVMYLGIRNDSGDGVKEWWVDRETRDREAEGWSGREMVGLRGGKIEIGMCEVIERSDRNIERDAC